MTTEEMEAEAGKNREAFETLRSDLEKITPSQYANTRGVSVETAVIETLRIGQLVRREEHYSRFDSLPKKEFDVARVFRLETSSRCLLHIIPLSQTADATITTVKLPLELVTAATEQRVKMIRVVKYHFEFHPVHGAEIADIVRGSGYPDLARDGERLANLYEHPDVKPVISQDVYYQADDSIKARALANRIYEEIRTQTQSNKPETDALYYSAWTLVSEDYEETRAAALFLFRHEPEMLKKFPPLTTLGRAFPSPRRKGPPGGGDGGDGDVGGSI